MSRLGTGTAVDRNPFRSSFVGAAEFTVGAEAGNVITVAVQLRGGARADLPAPGGVFVYLSDDSAGQSLAASAPSGGWAAGTDGLLIPVVANKAAYFISEADGDIDIAITEATAKDFWVCVVLPSGEVKTKKVTFA